MTETDCSGFFDQVVFEQNLLKGRSFFTRSDLYAFFNFDEFFSYKELEARAIRNVCKFQIADFKENVELQRRRLKMQKFYQESEQSFKDLSIKADECVGSCLDTTPDDSPDSFSICKNECLKKFNLDSTATLLKLKTLITQFF